jgi:hypothetical protein
MFRANDIDGKLLGRLTNANFKDIGGASFGHRKKLLEAIAELGSAPVGAHRRTKTGDVDLIIIQPQRGPDGGCGSVCWPSSLGRRAPRARGDSTARG